MQKGKLTIMQRRTRTISGLENASKAKTAKQRKAKARRRRRSRSAKEARKLNW